MARALTMAQQTIVGQIFTPLIQAIRTHLSPEAAKQILSSILSKNPIDLDGAKVLGLVNLDVNLQPDVKNAITKLCDFMLNPADAINKYKLELTLDAEQIQDINRTNPRDKNDVGVLGSYLLAGIIEAEEDITENAVEELQEAKEKLQALENENRILRLKLNQSKMEDEKKANSKTTAQSIELQRQALEAANNQNSFVNSTKNREPLPAVAINAPTNKLTPMELDDLKGKLEYTLFAFNDSTYQQRFDRDSLSNLIKHHLKKNNDIITPLLAVPALLQLLTKDDWLAFADSSFLAAKFLLEETLKEEPVSGIDKNDFVNIFVKKHDDRYYPSSEPERQEQTAFYSSPAYAQYSAYLIWHKLVTTIIQIKLIINNSTTPKLLLSTEKISELGHIEPVVLQKAIDYADIYKISEPRRNEFLLEESIRNKLTPQQLIKIATSSRHLMETFLNEFLNTLGNKEKFQLLRGNITFHVNLTDNQRKQVLNSITQLNELNDLEMQYYYEQQPADWQKMQLLSTSSLYNKTVSLSTRIKEAKKHGILMQFFEAQKSLENFDNNGLVNCLIYYQFSLTGQEISSILSHLLSAQDRNSLLTLTKKFSRFAEALLDITDWYDKVKNPGNFLEELCIAQPSVAKKVTEDSALQNVIIHRSDKKVQSPKVKGLLHLEPLITRTQTTITNQPQENKSLDDSPSLFKMVLIGDSRVGKSLFLQYLVDNTHIPRNTTPTRDPYFKLIPYQNGGSKVTKLQIWDTPGVHIYGGSESDLKLGEHAIIFFYDVTSGNSFENLVPWLFNAGLYANKNAVKIIIGTKTDLLGQRMVPNKKASEFAELHNCLYIETSAVNGENVQKAITMTIKAIMDRLPQLNRAKLDLKTHEALRNITYAGSVAGSPQIKAARAMGTQVASMTQFLDIYQAFKKVYDDNFKYKLSSSFAPSIPEGEMEEWHSIWVAVREFAMEKLVENVNDAQKQEKLELLNKAKDTNLIKATITTSFGTSFIKAFSKSPEQLQIQQWIDEIESYSPDQSNQNIL